MKRISQTSLGKKENWSFILPCLVAVLTVSHWEFQAGLFITPSDFAISQGISKASQPIIAGVLINCNGSVNHE